MYCIVRDTYLYIIDVRTDHAVLCVVLFGTHWSIYCLAHIGLSTDGLLKSALRTSAAANERHRIISPL